MNICVYIGEQTNFIYFSKFTISLCMKLVLVVLDDVVPDVVVNALYGLISINSSSSTLSFFNSFFCSSSLHKF